MAFLPKEAQKCLKKLYSKPPVSLGFLEKMRDDNGLLACPMCGSMGTGTLDHLLPKAKYPQFSILSINLVPACHTCNNKRGEALTGRGGERVLHPYFDNCLKGRVVISKIESLGLLPRVAITPNVRSTHPEYEAINFHIERIVKKTKVAKRLRDRFTKLCRDPGSVIRALENNNFRNANEIRGILITELRHLDREYESKNNWRSMFVAGLINKENVQWLFNHLTAPGRGPRDPLVATALL